MARVIRRRDEGEFREAIPAARPAYIRSQPVIVERRDRLVGLVYAVAGVIDLLLLIRFLLRLAGVGTSLFTRFIFDVTYPLMRPFLGIFPSGVLHTGLIEWSTVFAILVYAVAAYVIVAFIRVIRGW